MMSRTTWISGLAIAFILVACSSEDDTSLGQADQAISALIQVDEEAVQACEAKAQGCSEEHGGGATAACEGLSASCEQLDSDLAQVREQAVKCWEATRECKGEKCSEDAEQCRTVSDVVGEARKGVVDCAEHVQRCMLNTAGDSSGEEKGELCGELQAACGAGVVSASVTQVREAAQQRESSQVQVQDGAGDVTEVHDGEATQEQVQDGEATQEQVQDGEATQSGDMVQEQKRACLEQVATCGDAMGSEAADLTRLREGGQACDLGLCGAE